MKIPELPKIEIDDEVKVITAVCCLLDKLGELTESLLLEIVTVDDLITQFKLNDALTVIENKGLAELTQKGYRITAEGGTWLSRFENFVPVSLRRKLIRDGKEAVRLNELKKAVRWNVTREMREKGEKGDWVFYACFLNEMDGSRVMEIKLYSKTEEGAVKAREKFLKDPAKAFSECIANFI